MLYRFRKFLNLDKQPFVLREYVWITIGVLLLAAALDIFLVSNKLVSGGVSGIATILYYLTGMPIGLSVLLFNIVLFIIGFKEIGGGFGLKSVYAVLLFSVALDLIHRLNPWLAYENDLLLAVIFGNLLGGIGVGLVFNQDASTGGTDILARILNKYTALDLGKALMVFDLLIASSAGLAMRSIDIALYSLLAVIINTLVIDEFIGTFSFKKSVFIISRYPEEILDRVLREVGRGATILYGTGAYERRDQKIILTVVNRRQVVKIRNIVRDTDPQGFVIIGTVNEVLGEGFRDLAKP